MKNLIGKKLKEIGKSRAWLAKRTGLSRPTINRLVRDENSIPHTLNAIKICRAMGSLRLIDELFI